MSGCYYINPYGGFSGFYVKDADDLQDQLDELEACAVVVEDETGERPPIMEEYDIELVDEPFDGAGQLYKAMGVNASNFREWCEDVVDMEREQHAALFVLCDEMGYSFEDALEKVRNRDYHVSEQTAREYCEDYVDDCLDLPEIAQRYFDYESFTRDCLIDDITEFEFDGSTWVGDKNA